MSEPNPTPETWKPAPHYEDLYEVSTLGNCRRIQQNLRPSLDVHGYQYVTFSRNGKLKRVKVAHLVAEAFIGPRPSKHVVNHQDGVRHNNRVENLEYTTYSGNLKHAYRIGLHVPMRGEAHPGAKISCAQVEEVWKQIASGKRNVEIAATLGVSYATVRSIRRG